MLVNLNALKEKLSEKYKISDESILNDKLFYLLYVIEPNLTKQINRKKVISVGAGKGGTGKSKTSSDLADLIARAGKNTIFIDGDPFGPNQFRRMKGTIENFDFEKLYKLTEESKSTGDKAKVIEYFEENAPITNNAKKTLIDWYKKEILGELNLTHLLMYRDTINSDHYKKKLKIEDVPVYAGENLRIVLGLLETDTYPLAINSEKRFKEMVSSVISLPADKIVIDTPPGVTPVSLYLFNIGDVRYVTAFSDDMASLEEPMNFVKGSIAYMIQEKANNLPSLQDKIKEVELNYEEASETFNKKTTQLSEKEKIVNYNWAEYIKKKFIDSGSFSMNDNAFKLINAIIDYSKIKYEKDQLEGLDMHKSVIKELQEDAQKLSTFEDLTPIGISLRKFVDKHKDKDFVKKILKYISDTTYFIPNNVPHGDENDAKEKLKFVFNYFKSNYKVHLQKIPGDSFIYSLGEMSQATGLAIPSSRYLSKLDNNFDSPITKKYNNQLKDLIKPLVI